MSWGCPAAWNLKHIECMSICVLWWHGRLNFESHWLHKYLLPHVQTLYVSWGCPADWNLNHINCMSIWFPHVQTIYVSWGDPADWILNHIDCMLHEYFLPHVQTFYVSWGDPADWKYFLFLFLSTVLCIVFCIEINHGISSRRMVGIWLTNIKWWQMVNKSCSTRTILLRSKLFLLLSTMINQSLESN